MAPCNSGVAVEYVGLTHSNLLTKVLSAHPNVGKGRLLRARLKELEGTGEVTTKQAWAGNSCFNLVVFFFAKAIRQRLQLKDEPCQVCQLNASLTRRY